MNIKCKPSAQYSAVIDTACIYGANACGVVRVQTTACTYMSLCDYVNVTARTVYVL